MSFLAIDQLSVAHAQNTTAATTNVTQLINTTIATFLNNTNNSNNNFVNTTTSTTTPTTTPQPTTTSTLSPEQIYHQKCTIDHDNWLPTEALTCGNPFALCFFDVLDGINEYLKCKTYLNGTQPSNAVKDTSPMIVASYLYRMSGNILAAFEYIKRTNPFLAGRDSARRTIGVQSNFIFATGLQYRYGDLVWPNYQDTIFQNQRPRKKWNKRNDSITIPYGSLPRTHEYHYYFSAWENLPDNTITDKEQVRLMDSWPDHHAIWQGSYMDYMAEPDLYYKDNLKINTALLQASIYPKVEVPLPGEIVVVFNHKNHNMKNPVCVYWQYIKPDDPHEIPGAGYWSNYGMAYRNGNSTMTVCKAYHYGIYAVLMEEIVEEVDEFDFWGMAMLLGMLVAIVLSVSFIFAMFMFKLHLDIYCRLFMYTSFAVFLFQDTFLYAYIRRKVWNDCTSMSAVMELWQTQITVWILVQLIHQYSRLRLFFNDKTNVEALYLILGWGVPIAVVVALQGFPHIHYEELRYCWALFSGMQWMYFAMPLVAISFSSFFTMFLITKEIKKFPEKAEKDVNFIRSTKSMKSSTIVLLLVGASWIVGTYGLRSEGWTQIILMLGQPFINIILSWQMWSFYFNDNDAVQDALEENRKIKEYQRFRRFKHLQGVKMKVKYEAMDGDMETNLDELYKEEKVNEVNPFHNDGFEDVDLDDLIDFDDDDRPDMKN